MKINENYTRSVETQNYIDAVVEEQKQIKRVKTTPSLIQCMSTTRTLERDPSKDELWAKRTVNPIAAYADPDAEKCFAATGRSMDQILHFEAIRRRPKNTIGQSENKGYSEERKQLAISAFTCSPPAKLTPTEIERVTRIEPIKEIKKLEVWKPMTFWHAMWHRLKGNKIKQEEIK